MANQVNQVLEDLNVRPIQRPVWDQAGRVRQVVTAYFTTPSGFEGNVEMDLADWSDPEIRAGKVVEAAASLDWRLAEALEAQGKKKK